MIIRNILFEIVFRKINDYLYKNNHLLYQEC
jgi:hypothetical protein